MKDLKIDRATLQLQYAIEAIDAMIDEEQKSLENYKETYRETYKEEPSDNLLDMSSRMHIIDLKSVKSRLQDIKKTLEKTY